MLTYIFVLFCFGLSAQDVDLPLRGNRVRGRDRAHHHAVPPWNRESVDVHRSLVHHFEHYDVHVAPNYHGQFDFITRVVTYNRKALTK